MDRDSDIDLPEPGATKSLSANKDLYIDGIIPSIGDVRDGGSEDLQYTSSLTELDLNWTSFDDKSSSGIKRYFVGLGSTPGGVEVKPFVDVGNLNQYSFKNLTLTNGLCEILGERYSLLCEVSTMPFRNIRTFEKRMVVF